jgi:hypothetical protein
MRAMRKTRDAKIASRVRRRNTGVSIKSARTGRGRFGKRARGIQREECLPFSPPEDWHEPSELPETKSGPYDFKIVQQDPGPGFRHVVTPEEVRQRLGNLPAEFVAPLEVVQFSRMTRKKSLFACYGMQWGSTVYLYPLESDRIERHCQPPKPAYLQEAKMYGGRWRQTSDSEWHLSWTEAALKDFYLNNILIHELGHLLDQRNSSYVDRERYAEWFALHHGYKPSCRRRRVKSRKVIKRHHRC